MRELREVIHLISAAFKVDFKSSTTNFSREYEYSHVNMNIRIIIMNIEFFRVKIC